MSEYIVDFGDAVKEYIALFGKRMAQYVMGNPIKEQIVRCRDCRYYREHKWFEVVVGTPLGTDISDVCMFFADGCKVEPDGFCAWAKRKEGGE